MPKLPPFDVAAWSKGVQFTIPAGSSWGDHEATIKVGRAKKIKPVKSIKPSNRMVVAPGDSGRSVKDVRKMVKLYGERYDAGLDPLTGKPIKDIASLEYFTEDGLTGELRERDTPRVVNELTGCNAPRIDKPWTANRGGVHSDTEGLAILTAALTGSGVDEDD